MDDSASKAIQIAVGIFITIIITTGVFFVINNIKDIYGNVYQTNVGLQNEFYDFDQYENTVMTGIDLLNTVKKYLDNNLVKVYVDNDGTPVNTKSSDYYKVYLNARENSDYIYGSDLKNHLSKIGEKKYDVTYEETTYGYVYIYFKSK